jgi:hypothetical protein
MDSKKAARHKAMCRAVSFLWTSKTRYSLVMSFCSEHQLQREGEAVNVLRGLAAACFHYTVGLRCFSKQRCSFRMVSFIQRFLENKPWLRKLLIKIYTSLSFFWNTSLHTYQLSSSKSKKDRREKNVSCAVCEQWIRKIGGEITCAKRRSNIHMLSNRFLRTLKHVTTNDLRAILHLKSRKRWGHVRKGCLNIHMLSRRCLAYLQKYNNNYSVCYKTSKNLRPFN